MDLRNNTLKITKKTILFIVTGLSFLSILLFLMFFAVFAPGNYQLGLINDLTKPSIPNIMFAMLLLINDICVFLSFFMFLRVCFFIVRDRKFTPVYLGVIVMGLYPIVCISFLCSWKFSLLIQYFFAPVRMIFRF